MVIEYLNDYFSLSIKIYLKFNIFENVQLQKKNMKLNKSYEIGGGCICYQFADLLAGHEAVVGLVVGHVRGHQTSKYIRS